MTQHLPLDQRKIQILDAALKLAATRGYAHLSRKEIMSEVGLADATLSLHFGPMPAFRRALMRYAIKKENLVVVGQGLMHGDPIARKAPKELRARIAAKIA